MSIKVRQVAEIEFAALLAHCPCRIYDKIKE